MSQGLSIDFDDEQPRRILAFLSALEVCSKRQLARAWNKAADATLKCWHEALTWPIGFGKIWSIFFSRWH